MKAPEEIKDIVAEMRRRHFDVWVSEFRSYADRLEAAHKRERGDCAKLREAIDYLCERMADMDATFDPSEVECLRAALAEPPRNCDVGTAEEQEKRFHDFCRARHLPRMEDSSYCAYKCPLEGGTCCELQWAQMSYVAKEGGAK